MMQIFTSALLLVCVLVNANLGSPVSNQTLSPHQAMSNQTSFHAQQDPEPKSNQTVPSFTPQPIPPHNGTTTAAPSTTTTTKPTTPSPTPTTHNPPVPPTSPSTTVSPNSTTTISPPKPTTPTTTTTTSSTPSTAPTTPTIPTSTVSPHPTTAKPDHPADRKFDAFSFLGGFSLALGLVAIGILSWKFYMSRQENVYRTL